MKQNEKTEMEEAKKEKRDREKNKVLREITNKKSIFFKLYIHIYINNNDEII